MIMIKQERKADFSFLQNFLASCAPNSRTSVLLSADATDATVLESLLVSLSFSTDLRLS